MKRPDRILAQKDKKVTKGTVKRIDRGKPNLFRPRMSDNDTLLLLASSHKEK